jgi:hypothetical protein
MKAEVPYDHSKQLWSVIVPICMRELKSVQWWWHESVARSSAACVQRLA